MASASPFEAGLRRRDFLAAATALGLAACVRPAQAQDQRFDLYLDPIDGNDDRDGRSPERAVRGFGAAVDLMRRGMRLGVRRGGVVEGRLQLTDARIWDGCTIGAYGDGEPPVFRYVIRRTEPERHSGRIWKVPLAEMGLSTPAASQQITRATSAIIDGTRWTYIQVGSIREVIRPEHFFHDTRGGWLYFADPGTPRQVEIPVAGPIVIYGIRGLTLQDLEVSSSRDQGILAGSTDGLAILRCRVRRCGLVGICIFTRDETSARGPRIEDCVIEDTHGNGIGFSASSGGSKPNRITDFTVKRNVVRRACMGVPWVSSGVTSDDYYAGAIKLYSGIHDRRAWGWSGEITDNLIEHSGNLDRDMAGDHGQGIWIDTVTGSIRVLRNTVRATRGAGIFVEFCPDQEIEVAYNRVLDTGQRHGGWTGGICIGRGTTRCLVHHNTVWGARQACIVLQGVPGENSSPGAGSFPQSVGDCTIRDNILVPAAGASVIRESPVGGKPSVFARNCVGLQPRFEISDGRPFNFVGVGSMAAWENGRQAVSRSIMADPKLAAPPDDLRLLPGSPCLGAATDGTNIGAS